MTIIHFLDEGSVLRNGWMVRAEAKWTRSQIVSGAFGERKAPLLFISPPPVLGSGSVPRMDAVLFSSHPAMTESLNKEIRAGGLQEKKKKKKKKVSPRIIYSSGMQRGEPDLNLERERKRHDHYSRPSLSCSWQAAAGKFV